MYTSPEVKKKEVVLAQPPAAVGTDDEDTEEEESEEEDYVEQEKAKTPEPVAATPVLKKRYGAALLDTAQKEKEDAAAAAAAEAEAEVEAEKEKMRQSEGSGKRHSHHHHHHHLPHPDKPPEVEEVHKPMVLGEEDSWDDIKIGGSASPPRDASSSGTITSSGSGSSGSDESDSEWFYKDKNGVRQGPFDSTTINNWVNAGYLPMELEICEGGEGNRIWQPLGEIWNTSIGVDKTQIARTPGDKGDSSRREAGGAEIGFGDDMSPIKGNPNNRSII
jgi:hypothetical protein